MPFMVLSASSRVSTWPRSCTYFINSSCANLPPYPASLSDPFNGCPRR